MRGPHGSRRATNRARLALAALLLLGVPALFLTDPPDDPLTGAPPSATPESPAVPSVPDLPVLPGVDPAPNSPAPSTLPSGRRRLGADTMVVAYYGTAGTGVLGVLGERSPDRTMRGLRRTADAYARPGQPVQPAFELIVTVADRVPGPRRMFSHDISRAAVAEYVRAARRHKVLLVLDVQPGREPFLPVVRRWAWALRHPYVGLALDPEWRVRAPRRPGQVIGMVGAAEVNAVSAWLADVVRVHRLPEKLFILHQFRREMVADIDRVRARDGLVLVQHVDGFGTPRQKLATYRHVARPRQFRMGFKLFIDEDRLMLRPAQVLRIRPRVRFVSYQ